MEHLSEFRSSLTTLNRMTLSNDELSIQDKEDFQKILSKISEDFICHLGQKDCTTQNLDASLNQVYQFIGERELLSRGLKDRIIRYMKDIHEAIENLHAIHIHRTPISLKAYCKVFIFIFPVIYAPSVIYSLGMGTSHAVSYFIVILTEFILISLYNIQNQLEFPFDALGLDDIKLATFHMNR